MTARSASARRIWALNAVLGATGTLLIAGIIRTMPATMDGTKLPWWTIAIAFAATEAFVVHLPFRREAESFSLSEIPLVFGLFFLSPAALVAAQLVGSGASLALRRKQPAVKLVFNLVHMAVETSVALIVFRALSDGQLSSATTVAAFLATLSTIAIGVSTVVLAISLSEREFRFDMFRRVMGFGWIISTTNTSLALLGASVLRTEPALGWLLFVPATTLFFAYRAYTSESLKRRGVESLYGSTKTLQRSLHIDQTVRTLLDEARSMFRAEQAWVTFFPDEGSAESTRYLMGADGALDTGGIHLDPREGLWARVAAEGQALLLARPIRNDRVREYYARFGLRDLMIAPLFRDDQVIGTVTVGNRLGDATTFTADDIRLFETLVNHAGIALVNARLVSRLEEALARQTELNHLKDDFVATVSHELRTPLTSIKGFVKTLLRPGMVTEDEQRKHCLEIVERQTDRLQSMIEDLLLVSQIEGDRVHTSWSRVSPGALLRQVVDEFSPRAQSHNIVLDDAVEVPRIVSDEENIHRILSNLVENAVKYSPDGGDILLHAEQNEGGVLVRVRDHGVGIAEDLQERIFERFFQADQSKTRRAGGAGLGLFISRKLAEALGGRLWVETSGPAGSTFALWVPTRPSLPFVVDPGKAEQVPANVAGPAPASVAAQTA